MRGEIKNGRVHLSGYKDVTMICKRFICSGDSKRTKKKQFLVNLYKLVYNLLSICFSIRKFGNLLKVMSVCLSLIWMFCSFFASIRYP